MAKMLKVRVLDPAEMMSASEVRQGTIGQQVKVLSAFDVEDPSRRGNWLDWLSAEPAAGRVVVVPKSAVCTVFGGSDAGLDAIAGGDQAAMLTPGQQHTPDHREQGVVLSSMVPAPAADALAIPAVEMAPSAPLGDFVEALGDSGVLGTDVHIDTLQQTDPEAAMRKPPPLSANVCELFEAIGSASIEHLDVALAACSASDLLVRHSDHGGTCLHSAAGCADPYAATKMVAALCDAGADTNCRATNNSTPLHWAAGAGNEGAVNELLRRGADATLRSYTWRSNVFGKGSGQTAIHWAAESGHHNCVEALLNGAPLVSVLSDERGQIPTDLALKEGHKEVSKMLQSAAACEMVCLTVETEAAVHKVVPSLAT